MVVGLAPLKRGLRSGALRQPNLHGFDCVPTLSEGDRRVAPTRVIGGKGTDMLCPCPYIAWPLNWLTYRWW